MAAIIEGFHCISLIFELCMRHMIAVCMLNGQQCLTDLLFPVQSNLVVALEWTITVLAGRQLVGGRVDIAIAQAEGEGRRYSVKRAYTCTVV